MLFITQEHTLSWISSLRYTDNFLIKICAYTLWFIICIYLTINCSYNFITDFFYYINIINVLLISFSVAAWL